MKKALMVFAAMLAIFAVDVHGQNPLTPPKPHTTSPQQNPPKPKPSRKPKVNIGESDGYLNGHGYVDLGLPSGTKWATCNVGANRPSDYGEERPWATDKDLADIFRHSNSPYHKRYQLIRDELNSIGNSCISWGSRWKMPSKSEFNELIEKCKWVWITENGHTGYKVTGPNGKSIFLPAERHNNWGNYWSRSVNPIKPDKKNIHRCHVWIVQLKIGGDTVYTLNDCMPIDFISRKEAAVRPVAK